MHALPLGTSPEPETATTFKRWILNHRASSKACYI